MMDIATQCVQRNCSIRRVTHTHTQIFLVALLRGDSILSTFAFLHAINEIRKSDILVKK
jgi:hypothetical protein